MLRSLISTQPVIHLSFFTGIGVSQLALHYLNSNVVQTFSWEIDPFCNELLDHHYHPNIQHMGDIAATDFEAFCQTLSAQYDTTHIILITAAPPCKDHSRVRDTPPGLAGADGSLLQQMSNIHMIIKQKLPQRHSTSHYQTTIPTNLTTIGIRSDYPRRCRRQCHISPTTVVDRHRLAIYPTPTYQRNTMDITLDPT